MAATYLNTSLNNMHVVACGNLSSMTHARFAEFISRRGGVLMRTVTPSTRLIVEGENAAGTRKFHRLLESADKSSGVEVVTENQLFRRLGLLPEDSNCGLFSIADVAQLAGVPGKVLRGWIDSGLIVPHRVRDGVCLFEYAQLADARSIAALLKRGVAPRAIRHAVAVAESNGVRVRPVQLVHQPGQKLAYRNNDGELVAPDGTAFVSDDSACGVEATLRVIALPVDFSGAVETAIELELQGEFEQAAAIYADVLDAGPEDEVLYFNLGNVQLAMGEVDAAIASYQRSVELDPHYAEAWNNLANAYCDANDLHNAVAAYQTALHHAPQYDDAHFNLAETFFVLGNLRYATRHWRACLSGSAETQEAARQRLEEVHADV